MGTKVEGVSLKCYREASDSHLKSCRKLLENNEEEAERRNEDKTKEIEKYLQECYYLSGYIYECSLIYMMYLSIKEDINIEYVVPKNFKVRKLEFRELLLKNSITKNNADKIINNLYKYSHNIVLLNELVYDIRRYNVKRELHALAQQWSTDYRYVDHSALSIRELLELLNEAKEYLNLIK